MSGILKTTTELRLACDRVREDGVLSLDTEFVWIRTYRPQLGLLQIGCRTGCWALDTMCGLDVSPLGELIADAGIVKILHDARQDLAHVRRYVGAAPANVFDTQLAAAFSGFPGGIGLQRLLQEAIGVGLAKTETCTDWMQRPLSEEQVKYALDDVRYLPELRDELLRRMNELGTRAWLDAELLRYDDVTLYEDYDPAEVWKRVKLRSVRLDGRGRAVLRVVATLREELARKWNLPRNWLGDDDSLAGMAAAGCVGHLNHRLRGGQGDTIRALYAEEIRKAMELPEDEWPVDPRRYYIEEVREAADAALDWLAERSVAIHVDAGVIANRATVTAFVDDVNDESNPLANGWRYEAVGREMAERFGVD